MRNTKEAEALGCMGYISPKTGFTVLTLRVQTAESIMKKLYSVQK